VVAVFIEYAHVYIGNSLDFGIKRTNIELSYVTNKLKGGRRCMGNGRTEEDILYDVQTVLDQAEVTGEILSIAAIARRAKCGRSTLYANQKTRELLIKRGILSNASLDLKAELRKSNEKGDSPNQNLLMEGRLKKAESRAKRLELELDQAKETIYQLVKKNKDLEGEIGSLRLKIQLILEGKAIL